MLGGDSHTDAHGSAYGWLMRGSVERRNSGWGYRVDLPRDPATGRRRQASRQGFARRRDAEAALVDLVRSFGQADGASRSDDEFTVASYLAGWLGGQTLGVSRATCRSYRVAAGRLLPIIGSVPLRRLSRFDVEAAIAVMLADGLSPATVRNTQMVLHKALTDAVRLDRLMVNAADGVEPPKIDRGSFRVWSVDELRLFLTAVREHHWFGVFVLLATTGMRRGEVLGLRWDVVDFDLSAVSVIRSVGTVDGEIVVTSPKTQAARRLVDVDANTLDVLRRLRDEQRRAGIKDPHGWVFRREPGGGPLRPESVSAAFDRLVARADVPRIRLHDLRHTYATLAVDTGMHPMVLSDRLGHSSVATTIDMYVHVAPPTARHAANAVAEQLFDLDES